MAEHLLIILTIYALGTLASAGTGVLLWRYQERSGALALILMMGAMVIWNGSLFLFSLTENPTIGSILIRTVFIGVAIVSMAKFVFVLEYTGREHLIRPQILVPLAIPALLTVFFAFVNPGNLFFATLDPATEQAGSIVFTFGPASLIPLVYGYTLNIILTVMILGFIYRSRTVYRGQSIVLLGGILATWVANAVYLLDILAFDVTAVGSVASGLFFTVAIVRYRLLDLMPIARDRVLDNVNDGIFVIDTNDRLIDVNPAGRRMLASIGVDTDSLVGQLFPSLFDDSELRERYETITSSHAETTLQFSTDSDHFQVAATPIDDGRGRHVGWLFISHDVTERKRREEQLEDQNKRLDRFASLVSHDLRNPLNVASGYLELVSGTDEDEEYLEEIEQSHERMETIIEDVLALARNGTDVTDPEAVALDTVTEQAWSGVDTGSARVTIDAETSILADPDRIRRLIENLFRNSIEHGTESGDGTGLEITVGMISADADGSIEGFYIEDDGVGIPACRRDQVLDDGYTTGAEGTGLGLSIVESIATAHDWSVRVAESDAGGARFEFSNVKPADPSVSVHPLE